MLVLVTTESLAKLFDEENMNLKKNLLSNFIKLKRVLIKNHIVDIGQYSHCCF